MIKATFVKRMDTGFAGDARLYRLDTLQRPRRYNGTFRGSHNHVIVSAAYVPMSGPETYIFPANKEGKVTSWSELPGSQRGYVSHEDALRDGGYDVQ